MSTPFNLTLFLTASDNVQRRRLFYLLHTEHSNISLSKNHKSNEKQFETVKYHLSIMRPILLVHVKSNNYFLIRQYSQSDIAAMVQYKLTLTV